MSTSSRIRKAIAYLTEGDDVWGGWENNVDYEVNGKGGNDKLYGHIGNDTLGGGDGDDEIYGGLGHDNVLGGSGHDKLFGGDGDDEVDGGYGNDEIFGGNGRDTIRGGNGRDRLFGGAGDDDIDGGAGDDELYGEAGHNRLSGGAGQDLIYGGEEADTISGGLDSDIVFSGGGSDSINGNEGEDALFAGAGHDTIDGGSGHDSLLGEDGQDSISGGEGNDYLNGGIGDDSLDGGAGTDTLHGYDGRDRLNGGAGNDIAYGGQGHDLVIGGLGSDTLYGEAGDDTLHGVQQVALEGVTDSLGAGTVDIYVGGSGQDLFVLGDSDRVFYDDGYAGTSGAGDYALIKDFNRLEDRIFLSGSASDYRVAALPSALTSSFSDIRAAGLYRDSNGNSTWDNTDELIAVVEHLTPETLVLDGAYFLYAESPAAIAWHPENDPSWELVFSDDFNGTSLDSSQWKTRYSHPFYEGRTNPWNGEFQAYVGDGETIDGVTYDAFDFDDGILSIVSQKVAQPVSLAVGDANSGFEAIKSFDYTSGLLTSEDSYAFTTGYIEIRAQMASGHGLWPAFWMLPTDGSWPPEIDIVESLGQRTDTVFNSLHTATSAGTTALDKAEQTFSGLDFSADFHTFSTHWTADKLTWFIDDQAVFSVEQNIPQTAMYLLANMAVGGYWPGSPDETTPETAAFNIDYIRVYQDAQGTLHGGSQSDVLTKALGHLSGEAGDDTLTTGAGDNLLSGGSGSDVLFAGAGADTLNGSDLAHAGRGEIDVLTGEAGADVFVLGEAAQVFYEDGDSATAGLLDYALITDFNPTEDFIQLVGDRTDYRLETATGGSSTEIWHQGPSSEADLIALLDQQIVTTFDSGFSFVA